MATAVLFETEFSGQMLKNLEIAEQACSDLSKAALNMSISGPTEPDFLTDRISETIDTTMENVKWIAMKYKPRSETENVFRRVEAVIMGVEKLDAVFEPFRDGDWDLADSKKELMNVSDHFMALFQLLRSLLDAWYTDILKRDRASLGVPPASQWTIKGRTRKENMVEVLKRKLQPAADDKGAPKRNNVLQMNVAPPASIPQEVIRTLEDMKDDVMSICHDITYIVEGVNPENTPATLIEIDRMLLQLDDEVGFIHTFWKKWIGRKPCRPEQLFKSVRELKREYDVFKIAENQVDVTKVGNWEEKMRKVWECFTEVHQLLDTLVSAAIDPSIMERNFPQQIPFAPKRKEHWWTEMDVTGMLQQAYDREHQKAAEPVGNEAAKESSQAPKQMPLQKESPSCCSDPRYPLTFQHSSPPIDFDPEFITIAKPKAHRERKVSRRKNTHPMRYPTTQDIEKKKQEKAAALQPAPPLPSHENLPQVLIASKTDTVNALFSANPAKPVSEGTTSKAPKTDTQSSVNAIAIFEALQQIAVKKSQQDAEQAPKVPEYDIYELIAAEERTPAGPFLKSMDDGPWDLQCAINANKRSKKSEEGVPQKEANPKMSSSASAPNQMQVRVTFYTMHNPQSVLMILKNDNALEQISEKAKELFPRAEYRLFYGDVNGPIYEFVNSEQIMAKIRITTFSRTPQLFIRLEPRTAYSAPEPAAPKKTKESKSSSSLKRIEANQEQTLKIVTKLFKESQQTATDLEKLAASLQNQSDEPKVDKKQIQNVKHSATCDACLGDIIGHRFKCLECPDFDLCEKCEKKSVHYEHAMVRIVCPRRTLIPNYITENAPKTIFPYYIQTRSNPEHIFVTITQDVPASAPAPPPAPAPVPEAEAEESKPATQQPDFREETRAALLTSAAVFKEAFHSLSNCFLDLADGAQAGMDKKIFEKSKVEAGMAMVEDKIDVLSKQFEEKCFGVTEPEPKKEEVPKKEEEAPKKEKTSKKHRTSVYKTVAQQPVFTDLEKDVAKTLAYLKNAHNASDSERIRAHMRAQESTAQLKMKLEALTNAGAPTEQATTESPRDPRLGPLGTVPTSMDELVDLLNIPRPTVTAPTAPVADEPIPSAPVPEAEQETAQVETAASPDNSHVGNSIHSSFENIASDFEHISSSWDEDSDSSEAAPLQMEAPIQTPVVDVQLRSVRPPMDHRAENTFDRLLDMGFDYNVVAAVVKSHGPELDNCLAALL